MSLPMLLLLFTLFCLGMLLLPFYPAWHEWIHPTDNAALPVAAHPSNPGWGEDMAAGGQPRMASEDLHLSGGKTYSEMLSHGRLKIGASSIVSGWAHANGELMMGESSVAVNRISSAHTVDLAHGCCFERVQAPMVRFGQPMTSPPGSGVEGKQTDLQQLPGAVRCAEGLFRISGDCMVPDMCRFTGSLIVTGVLSIGAGSVIDGSVKAHQGILIGPGACVTGSVVCDNGVHVLSGASVGGPLLSETHLVLGAGARLGSAAAQTTVSADFIIAEAGSEAHGTVWARKAGAVWGRS